MDRKIKVEMYNHGEDSPSTTFLCDSKEEIREAFEECGKVLDYVLGKQERVIEKIPSEELHSQCIEGFLIYSTIKKEQLCIRIAIKNI